MSLSRAAARLSILSPQDGPSRCLRENLRPASPKYALKRHPARCIVDPIQEGSIFRLATREPCKLFLSPRFTLSDRELTATVIGHCRIPAALFSCARPFRTSSSRMIRRATPNDLSQYSTKRKESRINYHQEDPRFLPQRHRPKLHQISP
ncbi:uncharacterized protein BDW43DRAFT_135874 [Aspergillus alliaceus]|uniref:uncharacterized protein n=1 Tax=Petromyces alliaceus TaxID=209559 RepID=UPI0012A6427A|nr:uncharacterized protein BDW43DRAFT_135874 [Aspergillus alliaceus]KAB8231653.1 hypothetical protein BDW43DRAFT_135874 [Aspergillus alliaceus]